MGTARATTYTTNPRTGILGFLILENNSDQWHKVLGSEGPKGATCTSGLAASGTLYDLYGL